jgi:Ca-activated chloride channel homolog
MKILIAAFFALFFSLAVFAQTREAEVIVTISFLRKSPSVEADKVQTLQKGQKIIIENEPETNGWIYASVSKGKTKGWIRKEFVRLTAKVEKIEPKQTPVAAQISKPRATVENKAPDNIQPTAPTPAAAPASPDETVEDEEVLRVEAEEVRLNVRVVNNQNRPVNNLTEADFKIYEDNVLQPITYLAKTEVPIVNALVIDNSRSLRLQLKKIIEAGKIIVGQNRPADQSAVVRFVSRDKIEVVEDFTPDKNRLTSALDNLFVEGGQTAIIDAVYRAANKIEQYQNSEKREDVKLRSLILVSDGEDRGSQRGEHELFELLRNSNVQIYVIGFVNDLSRETISNGVSRQEKAKSFLAKLATETGGKVYFPDSLEELPQIAAEISDELRTQYSISYTPIGENNAATFRAIKVEISEGANKEKRIAITRTGRNVVPK